MSRLVSLAVLAGAATACAPQAVLTARNSVNPILIGPVTRIGGSTTTSNPSDVVGAFETHQGELRTGGGDSGGSSSFYDKSAVSQTDLDIAMATNGLAHRYVVLGSVSCGGFDLFAISAAWRESWCDASGVIAEGRTSTAPKSGTATAVVAPAAAQTRHLAVPAPPKSLLRP